MSERTPSEELDFALLRQVAKDQAASQRVLAKNLGVSVGKINYCLRAAISRGWIKVNNLRRSDNKLGYAYLLTPSGALAKVRLARAFLERKEREFEMLHAEISAIRNELQPESGAAEAEAPAPPPPSRP